MADEERGFAPDEGDRWTVRGVSREARAAVKARSDAAELSAGAWLTQLILSDTGAGVPADRSDKRAADSADKARQTAAATVADIERLVASATQLAGSDAVPKTVRAPLNRAIRDQAKRLAEASAPQLTLGLQTPADKAGRQA